MKIYDATGDERDWEWVKDKYNLPEIDRARKKVDHWEVVELRERIGPVAMRIRVVGEATVGIPIRIDWPGDHIVQKTNAEGYTDFVLNAYYRPLNIGPYSVCVVTRYPTDVVNGLGMLGKSNHAHLEPTFQFVRGEEPAPEEPEDGWKEKYEAMRKERDEKQKALSEIHAKAAEALGG